MNGFSLHFDHFCVVFLSCLLSEVMKRLHIERHLAAKTGTNFAVMDGLYVEVVLLLFF